MNTASSSTPPPTFLDTLLQLTPVDVLLFDTGLVCRYAAPAEDTLFGRTAEELVGRPATDIFPPAANGLGPVLQRAAREAAGWRDPHYRYAARTDGSQILYCWSVRIEPVAVEEYRGVLVTLADVQDLADENQRLQVETERLRTVVRALEQRAATLRRDLQSLQTAIRTLLAPVVGFLQLIARRPHALAGTPETVIIEDYLLPRLRDVVATVDARMPRPIDEPPTTA